MGGKGQGEVRPRLAMRCVVLSAGVYTKVGEGGTVPLSHEPKVVGFRAVALLGKVFEDRGKQLTA